VCRVLELLACAPRRHRLVDYSGEALEEPFRGTLESFTKAMAMAYQVHTCTELRQQIHGDLRIQHPEWVEPNGESSMRLMELLDTLTRRGSNESIAAPQRALEQGTGR
jgi:hypothetical protein